MPDHNIPRQRRRKTKARRHGIDIEPDPRLFGGNLNGILAMVIRDRFLRAGADPDDGNAGYDPALQAIPVKILVDDAAERASGIPPNNPVGTEPISASL